MSFKQNSHQTLNELWDGKSANGITKSQFKILLNLSLHKKYNINSETLLSLLMHNLNANEMNTFRKAF